MRNKMQIRFNSRSIVVHWLIVVCLIGIMIPTTALSFNVTAQVDRNRISINDSIVLKIIFEDGEGEVDTSNLTDFDILSRSSSSNISIINGKYSKTITSIYRLVPLKKGRLSIPSFKVSHKRKVYATRPITIDVSAADAKPGASTDIFVEAGLSGTSLYVGQQAVYQLRLFSAVRFSNATLQEPSFNGFTAKEVGERQKYQTTINGRVYHVIAVNYVLIPEQAGNIEIEPAVITCDVVVKGRRSDPFDDPFFSNNFFGFGRSEKRRFSTGPLSVEVLPLPEYTQSHPPFSGVVGDVKINASLDRNDLTAGESVTLTITLSGGGNLMDAQSPEINLSSDVKLYEDAPVEEIELTPDGYAGTKEFKKAIVPIKEGTYTIAPVAFSFFNVSNRQYEVVKTASLSFNVSPSAENVAGGNNVVNITGANGAGAGTGAESSPGLARREKQNVELIGNDILGLKEGNDGLHHKRKLPLPMFGVLFFLPCFLFYLLKLFLIFGKKEISIAASLEKKAKEALSTAEKMKKEISGKDGAGKINREDYLKALHGAVTAKVFAKAGVKGESLTSGEVETYLTSSGCEPDVSSQVNALLGEIESARYGRQKDDAAYRELLLKKTRSVFQMLGMVALIVGASLVVTMGSMGFAQITFAQSDQSQSTQSDQSDLKEDADGLTGIKESGEDDYADSQKRSDFHPSNPQFAGPSTDPSGEAGYGRYFFQGVEAYRQGRFEEAATIFKTIAQQGVHNAKLYYNIGNSFLKAGRIGQAVLWYERAKKEIPLDPDLRFNLAYADGLLKDKVDSDVKVDFSKILFFWRDYLPAEMLKYTALLLSFLFFTYAAIRTVRNKKVLTLGGSIFFGVWMAVGGTAFYAGYQSIATNNAVIIAPEASVRSATSDNATELFILHAGTRVKVQKVMSGYLKIYFSEGKIGWVSRQDAEII